MSLAFEGSSLLAVPHDKRVHLAVDLLLASVKNKSGDFPILDNVSLELPPAQMLAIMGGLGSGKTTLLNVLAQRLGKSHALHFDGAVAYTTNSGKERLTTAYMQQEDVFLPGLTLRETLCYQAELRLHGSLKAERETLVDLLLAILELAHRAHEVVKLFTNRVNLLGGEQRRTSLAIQLLNKPQVLFLDEPTTGLDTALALVLVLALRKLALPQIGITVVILIHQPRLEVARLFDSLCVLTRGGRQVYCGLLAGLAEYFAELAKRNIVRDAGASEPFEVFNKIMQMLVTTYHSVEEEKATLALVAELVAAWRQRTPGRAVPPEELKRCFSENLRLFKPKLPLPLWREVAVLTRRTTLMSVRDKQSLFGLSGGLLFLGVCCGWIFWKIKADLAGIRLITLALYVMLEVVGFAPLLFELERLWNHDGIFFFKEYKENCVTIPGFLLSRRIAKFWLEDVPYTFLFAVVAYFMMGLRLGATLTLPHNMPMFFGIYFAVTLFAGLVAMSSAMLCFALGNDFAFSSLVANALYQLQNSGCGYFVNAATMPVYVRWVKYLAYFWYAFGALTANQYTQWIGNCPYPISDDRCIQYSGEFQLKVLGYPQYWIGKPIGILVCWAAGFNIIAGIVLKLRNYDVVVAKKRKNKIGGSVALSVVNSGKEVEEGMSVEMNSVTLSVNVSSLFRSETRVLLDNVLAEFRPNLVNVIMGPSGGGKTTLLNFLASRLARSSSFAATGSVSINQFDVSTRDLAKIAAYVTQHDNLLIAELTVRETLYYQACLRLPVEQHPHIPDVVTQLLRQTGLVECADTPVGDHKRKGISGGEKRRVSVAIQLLSSPRILFLDEPTLGLDSATAALIMRLLADLAKRGTTIVLTIHQPSLEIFWSCDALVLLARGGHVVYNGLVADAPTYFSKMGLECPRGVNFADHMLDMILVRLGEQREVLQARIDYLVQLWVGKASFPREKFDVLEYVMPPVPLLVAFKAVCLRQFKVSFRLEDVIITRMLQTVLLAVIYTLFFAPLKNSQEGISNRLGLTQSVCNLYFVGLINNLAIYPSQRDLFYQEKKDGAYGTGVFSLAYLIIEVQFEILGCLFFSALVVFAIGLPRTPGMFFAMFLVLTLCINIGDSMGIIFNSIFDHLGLATNLLTNIIMIAVFMAGTMSLHMPRFFRAWNYINPVKYAVLIITKLGFENQHFSCGSAPDCSLRLGNDVMDRYGLDNNLGISIMALVVCLVVYRGIAVALTEVKVRWFK